MRRPESTYLQGRKEEKEREDDERKGTRKEEEGREKGDRTRGMQEREKGKECR